MNLLIAELWRCWSRRVTKIMLLLGFLVITGVMVWLFLRPQYKEQRNFVFEACEFNEEGEPIACPPEEVIARVDQRVDLVDDLSDAMAGTGTALTVLGVLLGSTLLGAEFGAASLSTQLAFEPRRGRVWITKAAAVAVATAAVCVVLLLLLGAELAVVAAARGITDGVDAAWLGDRALELARLAGAGALGALFGFGITGIARRTVAAIVAFLVMFAIVEPLLVNTFSWAERRMPMEALTLFAFDPFVRGDGDGGYTSLLNAATVASVWIVAIVAIAGLLFQRAEIR